MNTTGTVLQDRYHIPNDRCVDHNNCFQTFTGRTLVWDFVNRRAKRTPRIASSENVTSRVSVGRWLMDQR
jgi:hypothetical protein